MRKIFAIALLLLSNVAYGQDRSGIYEVRGAELQQDGSKRKYVGIMILKKTSAENQYVAQWTAAIGQNTTGVGFVRNGYMTFSWTNGQIHGVTEYKLMDGDTYKGRWFHSRDTQWHEEDVIFKMKLPNPVEDDDAGEKAKKG
jgi:hypothetical protein